METWETLRANWVNGNRSQTKACLLKLPKKRLLEIMRVALTNCYATLDLSTNSYSGDLIDLLEILNSILREE